jgi:hypothetical protein
MVCPLVVCHAGAWDASTAVLVTDASTLVRPSVEFKWTTRRHRFVIRGTLRVLAKIRTKNAMVVSVDQNKRVSAFLGVVCNLQEIEEIFECHLVSFVCLSCGVAWDASPAGLVTDTSPSGGLDFFAVAVDIV